MDPAPGDKNLITDITGIQVGHAEDNKILTGVTVITGDNPFSTAVDVRGGGPGTRETDMLSLENSIGRADAIVLSGGSAFGLDACSEVQDLLRQENKGFPTALLITIAPTVYFLPFEKVCDHDEEPCPPLMIAVVAPHPAPKEPRRKSVLAALYALFASILHGVYSPIVFT